MIHLDITCESCHQTDFIAQAGNFDIAHLCFKVAISPATVFIARAVRLQLREASINIQNLSY